MWEGLRDNDICLFHTYFLVRAFQSIISPLRYIPWINVQSWPHSEAGFDDMMLKINVWSIFMIETSRDITST